MKRLWDRARRWLLSVAVSVGLAPADASNSLAPAPEQWTEGDFVFQHRNVAYRLFVPRRDAGKPRPLLLMLHGCTQSADDFAAGTRMNRLAEAEGMLVLYPTQTQRDNAGKCWNWFVPQHQRSDRGEAAMLAALTRSVMATHAVDASRVYVAGLSAGGAMADILAHTQPDLFAAVGVHSGLPVGAASDLMSALSAMKNGTNKSVPIDGPAVPTIVVHGDADETVNPRNGQALVDAALQRAGGDETLQMKESEGRSAGGRDFVRRTYTDGRGRPLVEQWLLRGAGHAWSGGSDEGSYTDPLGPDASAAMIAFFRAQRLAKPAS